MRRTFLILTLIAIVLIDTRFALAQPPTFQAAPYVYRIKATGCGKSSGSTQPERRQTGFRLKGVKGIVTALHGLSDCESQSIDAVTDDGAVFTRLSITAVNIDSDIAVLASPLITSTNEGWNVPSSTKFSLTGLHFFGYLYGNTTQLPTNQITVTQMMTLENVIPSLFRSDNFLARKSPNLKIQVFYTEANLGPGYSGSPVLNANNQVIGMVDGGLKDGESGKGWLIPWQDMLKTQPLYDSKGQLNPNIKVAWENLRKNAPELSLGFLTTFSIQPVQTANTFKYSGRIIDSFTRRSVAGAKVILAIKLTGENFVDYTDSIGSYSFLIPATSDRNEGEISIEMDGYTTFDQKVTLQPKPSQVDFRLVALPPTSTPTATFTPLPTATPTATQTPLPTSTPGPCLGKIDSHNELQTVNVHKGYQFDSKIIGQLLNGTVVEIKNKSKAIGGFYYIWSITGSKFPIGWIDPNEVDVYMSPTCPQ